MLKSTSLRFPPLNTGKSGELQEVVVEELASLSVAVVPFTWAILIPDYADT